MIILSAKEFSDERKDQKIEMEGIKGTVQREDISNKEKRHGH